jgi:hypothetical protein
LNAGRPREALDVIVNAVNARRDIPQFVNILAAMETQARTSMLASAKVARQAGADGRWPAAFRDAESKQTEARRAGQRRATPDSIRALWAADSLYQAASAEALRVQPHVERARTLYGQRNRADALRALTAAGDGYLQTAGADLIDRWRREAESAMTTAQVQAAGAGATAALSPPFRQGLDLQARATEQARAGNRAEALRSVWSAEESFIAAGAAAVMARNTAPPREAAPDKGGDAPANRAPGAGAAPPPRPAAAADGDASAAAAPPRPTTTVVSEAAIQQVFDRYRSAYQSKDISAVLQVYPTMSQEDRRAYSDQIRNCQQVDIRFSDIKLLPTDAVTARAETQTSYECVPKTRQGPLRVPPQADLFDLEASPDGTWRIKRKWK